MVKQKVPSMNLQFFILVGSPDSTMSYYLENSKSSQVFKYKSKGYKTLNIQYGKDTKIQKEISYLELLFGVFI